MFWIGLLDILRNWILPIIDILVVAFILYKAFVILYETKASLVLNGLIIVAAIYFVSIVLRLDTLNLLTKIFFTYGIITFIVVFQPEIRKALMRVGESRLFLSSLKTNITTLSEVVSAIKFMSKKKIGALIILKRHSGMKTIEETGVRIDAHVTSELIITVFAKNTPLHDGAVVIENDRLTYAACFLPLSEKKIPKEYGTRHRAALGLAEESDAVVLVVSEETGKISLAFKSELKTDFDDITLKNELNRILREPA